MGKKNLILAILFVAVLTFSCGTGSNKTQGDSSNDKSGSSEVVTEVFDPTKVSQALYTTTRDEVRHFIEDLNKIINRRDYNGWRACLSDEYFAEISSEKNLQEISSQPAMKTRKIALRTAEDYFQHVVVPSRADLRVDDIEFISSNRVKAFTITTNRAGEEVRLRLYDLEKIGKSWRIIN